MTEIDKILEGESKESEAITRIKELSNKVKITSAERDELAATKVTLETERDSAVKETNFYKSYADSAVKYPAAKEHQDEIKAKVLAGYDMEDAFVSVLAKAGKLNPETQRPDKISAAGGSASTTTQNNGGQKSVSEMTQAERREALKETLEWN